jgi:hypothetical protein
MATDEDENYFTVCFNASTIRVNNRQSYRFPRFLIKHNAMKMHREVEVYLLTLTLTLDGAEY